MSDRFPCATGRFYPTNMAQLKEKIRNCFTSILGPGLPENPSPTRLFAGIVPHARYSFSGENASWFYKQLGESQKPNTIILLGPIHTNTLTASIWKAGYWITPLGRMKVNSGLAERLIKTGFFDAKESAHQGEHSIEVQLPFIQYVFKTDTPMIVPIAVNLDLQKATLKKIASKLVSIVKEYKKNILILVSSDLTKYGLDYNYVPFHGNNSEIKMNLYKLDMEAVKHIENMDGDAFIDCILKHKNNFCGSASIAILLYALKELGARQGDLLKYTTSSSKTGNYNNSVSYASIMFK